MLKKRDKDKKFIKNWWPISLLKTDMKIISKVLSTRIKGVLPYLISSNQTAYVKNRSISDSGRSLLFIANSLKICIRNRFISWIKTILTAEKQQNISN